MMSLTMRRLAAASVVTVSLASVLAAPQAGAAVDTNAVIDNLSTKTQDGTSTKFDDDLKALNDLGNGFWSKAGSTKAQSNIEAAQDRLNVLVDADKLTGGNDPFGVVAAAQTNLEARKLEKAAFDMELVAVIVLPLLAALGIAQYLGVLPPELANLF